MSILIKNAEVAGKKTYVYIEENKIEDIGSKNEAEYVLDAKGKILLPGFINTHGHSAMTLLRGYQDDMVLQDWLEKEIWPFEAKMDEEDVYIGSKLACLEMIKSGTTCFCDMYWHMKGSARAASEMGLRAFLAESYIDFGQEDMAKKMQKENKEFIEYLKEMGEDRINASIGPHAIYTVSKESLSWVKDYAKKEDLTIQFHLAETEKENTDFEKKEGLRPVAFLEDIGFLSDKLVCAHSIWLTEKEIYSLKKHDVSASYNPTSNLKLASGIMPYPLMKKAGLTVSLGTDGCASNNNLDMFEEMKIGALAQKGFSSDPSAMSAKEIYDIATLGGAKALGIDAGQVKEGMLADLILIDNNRAELCPGSNPIADLVYSANGCCVETMICDGKVLMENRQVAGEEDIIKDARSAFERIKNR